MNTPQTGSGGLLQWIGVRLPEVGAFVLCLFVAARSGWDTGALVWSLWLSSLVVGFTSIFIGIGTSVHGARGALEHGSFQSERGARSLSHLATPVSLLLGALMLGFFTLHFGLFHLGHAVFLNLFFPIDGSASMSHTRLPGLSDYGQVLRQGWWFVPLALIAERHTLFPAKSAPALPPGTRLFAPYRNVVRLHLLIFCFALASGIGLGGAWIYLLVYATYFFPWRRPSLPAGDRHAPI